MFFTLTSTFVAILQLILHFVPSNLHSHSYAICLVIVFDSCFPLIMLKTLRIISSVLFGMHTLLGKSLTVLQLRIDLSNLTRKG